MKQLTSRLRLITTIHAQLIAALVFVIIIAPLTYAQGDPDHIHVVNSVGDESDVSLADGICKTVHNDCSLRAAIEQANNTANLTTGGDIIIDIPDEIIFEIDGTGVHTIRPESPLPNIADALRIDGYTQGDAKPNTLQIGSDAVLLIEIDGSLAGGLTHGLTLNSSGSTIRGLVINRFGESNLLLDGADENHIEGNYIGTDATGTMARPNKSDGIALFDSASNVIGGVSPDKRNVISGNNWAGVGILNGPSQGNIVEGNYIGTDASGMNAVPNGGDGVIISALVGVNTYASNNRIGGVGVGQRNIISGNGWSGVHVFRGTHNEILGNLIGTKADGTTRLPNQIDGVRINEASNNLVGGQFAGGGSETIAAYKRNLLSGNNGRGISIIVGTQSASGNRVVGNYIGTDVTGLQPVPNSSGGVLLGSVVGATGTVADNIIGGIDGSPETRNIISGNDSSGVSLVGPRVTTNEIVGNFIGLDKTGTAKLGNDLDGVRFTTFGSQSAGPTGNFIGTSTSTGGNVISGNGRDGVAIAFGSAGNFVVNNIIGLDDAGSGTDSDGTPDTGDELGNTRHGVAIFDSPNNSIGDGVIAHRNVISGNKGSGVFVGGGSNPGAATGNTVAGNFIGVDYIGLGVIGNMGDGVLIEEAPGNTIGGEQTGSGNIISGNMRDGVHISGNLSTGTEVTQNTIGLSSDHTIAIGNLRHGVFIADGFDNAIGAAENVVGDIDFLGNVIANNGGSGVVIESGTRCTIRGNQIFDNAGLGIDLGGDGLTENDDTDADSGPNDLQNFPTISNLSPEIQDGNTHVRVAFTGAPNTRYHIDFYANDTGDGISAGQGRTYLTTFSFIAKGDERVFIPIIEGEHRNITATATDENGNTSEFGRESLVHSVEFTQAIQIFQPLDELQSTLDDTDEPPVPMIAGKEGVMRVYLKEVDDVSTVAFEVEGEGFSRTTDSIMALPGCTPEDRRRGADVLNRKCLSMDFYFSDPPAGEWNTVLTLRTPSGDVFERHTFKQVTRTAKTLVLNAVSICHDIDTDGKNICGNEKVLAPNVGLLRSIAPTHEVRVAESFFQVQRRLTTANIDGLIGLDGHVGDFYEKDIWGITVLHDLANFHEWFHAAPSPTEQVHYFGITAADNVSAGLAYVDSFSAYGQDSVIRFRNTGNVETNFETYAHETGHMLGRPHTNLGYVGNGPPPDCYGIAGSSNPAPDWPYCDNTIQSGPGSAACLGNPTPEVGFDVANRRPLLPEATYDIMSYCNPRWIAPFTYLAIADKGLAPKTAPSLTAGETPPLAGSYWLVTGEVDKGAVNFGALLQLETEGSETTGEGSYRIEIRDSAEAVLSTRFFDPMTVVTEDDDQDVVIPPYFSELLLVQVGAASIVLVDDFDIELGRITLDGVAPTVTVDFTPGVVPLSGPHTIGWTIVDPDSVSHGVTVQYSSDSGLQWHNIASFEAASEFILDFDKLPGAIGSGIIRVLATDGINTGFGDSVAFSVTKKLPEVEIYFPETGAVFRFGQIVSLQAIASDGDDGSLGSTSVVWTSELDGEIGQGANLPLNSLSVGIHTITVTATDADDNVATHSIVITVEDSLLIETPAVINVPADALTIQAAIDVARFGDEVLVAPGTYDEIIDFHGKAIAVRSSGGAAVTTIDATNVTDPGDGKPVVRCDSGESANTVLDGFTITGGTGDTSLLGIDLPVGGGMFNFNANPTVMNCVFTENTAKIGGGMANRDFSSPKVTDCTFSANTALFGASGMENFNNSNAIVTNCIFDSNTTGSSGGGMSNSRSDPTVTSCMFMGNEANKGGGISNDRSNAIVIDCTFSENTVTFAGGGIINSGGSPTITNCTLIRNTAQDIGGAMHNGNSNTAVTHCLFGENTADVGGGGLYAADSVMTITNCSFNGNTTLFEGGGTNFVSGSSTLTSCAFSGNTAQFGGGICNRGSNPIVTNGTFSGNVAELGGGIYNSLSSNPIVTSSIFWMNSDLGGTDESSQIHNDDTLGPNSPTVNYSDIQGGWTGLGGTGNINSDPYFMDADGPDNVTGTEDDDLRLPPGSPCIDNGDPAFVADPGVTDLAGHDRVLCGRVDMGAYEFDCNLINNLGFFSNWNACMTGPGGGPFVNECAVFDFDGDLDIDLRDFAEFEKWFTP